MKLYTPDEKVAAVLISLGEELAAEIFRHLNPQEVQRLSLAMSRLGRVSQEDVNMIFQEFLEVANKESKDIQGGTDVARRLLQHAFKDHDMSQLIGRSRLEALDHVSPEQIASLIKDEIPQTQAVILAHIDARKSSQVIQLLPGKIRSQVLLRIAKLEPVNPDALDELNQSLLEKTKTLSTDANTLKKGGPEAVSKMLGKLDQDTAKKLLSELADKDPTLADEIRSKMFSFDDISRLADQDVLELIKRVDRGQLTIAMRKCSKETQTKIFRNLSERAAELLKEDSDALGPTRVKDVEEAQRRIVTLLLKMDEEGVIDLSGSDTWV